MRIIIALVSGLDFQFFANFESAELGHHDIEQNQISLKAGNLIKRILAIDSNGCFRNRCQ